MTKLTMLLLLVGLAAMPIVAGQVLPWWGGLTVLVMEITVILAFAPRVIAALVRQRLIAIFRQRSRALEGALVEVHGVREISADQFEADEPGEEPADGAKRHVEVDFTLRPIAAAEYRPSELGLIAADAPTQVEGEAANDEPAAYAQRVRLISDEGEHQCDQLSGEARLRIVFGIPAGFCETAQFRYFFARFGRVKLL